MKVIIELELPRNGSLSGRGVTELLRRLAKVMAHLLRNNHAVQPFTVKDKAGETLADVRLEFRLCATPTAEAFARAYGAV